MRWLRVAPWLEPSCPTDTLSARGPTRLCNAAAVNPSHGCSCTGTEPGLHPDLLSLGMGPLGHFGVIPQVGDTSLPLRAAARHGGHVSVSPRCPGPLLRPGPGRVRPLQPSSACPEPGRRLRCFRQSQSCPPRRKTRPFSRTGTPSSPPPPPRERASLLHPKTRQAMQDPATGVWTLPLWCRGHRWPHPPPSPRPYDLAPGGGDHPKTLSTPLSPGTCHDPTAAGGFLELGPLQPAPWGLGAPG